MLQKSFLLIALAVSGAVHAQDAPSWRTETPTRPELPDAEISKPAVDFSIDRDQLFGSMPGQDGDSGMVSGVQPTTSQPELGRKATWRERFSGSLEEEQNEPRGTSATTDDSGTAITDTPEVSSLSASDVEQAGFQLTPRRTVDPEYPRQAARDGVAGWVDVLVTVAPDGKVIHSEVLNAEPPRVFERSAIRAIDRWRFEPPEDAGINDPQEGTYRISFVLED